MRTLVIGSGAREHALAWKLSQESDVVVAPGNPGMAQDVELAQVAQNDAAGLVKLARQRSVDLVVVGPEDPLIEGIADSLREAGLRVFGPGAAGARLEGSKDFSKHLMTEAGIPTAAFRSFSDFNEALEYTRKRYAAGEAVAVKASGNALGKGVVVAPTLAEAEDALKRMLVHKEFGSAGETVVVEQLLVGREFSLMTIVGDRNFVSLPIAQDYKRVFDGDQGPNTGGMGTYSPCDWVSRELVEQVEQTMVAPLLHEIRRQGIEYRGTLFTGVMVTEERSYCLEYNVRFGDPETQTLMTRLGTGLLGAFTQAASGDAIEAPRVQEIAAVTIAIASGGYPGHYSKGLPVHIGAMSSKAKIFYAGVAEQGGVLVTAGGRVLSVTATGEDLEQARGTAYEAANQVRFEGAFYRRDIAQFPQPTG